MATDDKTAKRARAESLRKRIGGLTQGAPSPARPPGSESPAEFVHRRMRELDKVPKKPR